MLKKIGKWAFLFLAVLFGVVSVCFFFSKLYVLGFFFFLGYFGCFETYEALKKLIFYEKVNTLDKQSKL